MNNRQSSLPITISLLGIAFMLHFLGTQYYFFGSPPTGFSTGTLGLIIASFGIIMSYYDMKNNK